MRAVASWVPDRAVPLTRAVPSGMTTRWWRPSPAVIPGRTAAGGADPGPTRCQSASETQHTDP